LPFSKQETFPDSVFIPEFNAGSLQSGLDRLYCFLGNQSSVFFKIDDRVTASQIAAASLASFLLRFRYAF
jgi:hypothetical protein